VIDEFPMRLFTPDLFRNFGIGFALGALLIVVGANAQGPGAAGATPAQAAGPFQAPAPTADFAIAPVKG
jgi:hypothetical protein